MHLILLEMKLKSILFGNFPLISFLACASMEAMQSPIEAPKRESVEVDVPLEVCLAFNVPKLARLRIDYLDKDGQSGLTSMEEIYQIIPVYRGVSGRDIPDPLSPEQAYGIFLSSKK